MKRPQLRRNSWGAKPAIVLISVLLLAVGLVASGCSEGGSPTTTSREGTTTAITAGTTATTATTPPSTPSGTPPISPAESVAAKVGPSVVNVRAAGVVQGFFGSEKLEGVGSGVIIRSDGMIVTNEHVVTINDVPAQSLIVTLATGEELSARVIGLDDLTDLAVIKVDRTGLPAANFLESLDSVRIGEYAIAIGSPLDYRNSVTLGVVSGLNRAIAASDVRQRRALVDLIQTDAAISPGNSGGALVDSQGRVIGMNVAYLPPGSTGAQNIGFAIPAYTVVDVAEQIISTGRARHAYLGVSVLTVDEQLKQNFRLSRSAGVLVARLGAGTPAEKAGLRQGDIIIELDGKKVDEDTDLYAILRQKRVGDSLKIRYDRNGKEQATSATLGEMPATNY